MDKKKMVVTIVSYLFVLAVLDISAVYAKDLPLTGLILIYALSAVMFLLAIRVFGNSIKPYLLGFPHILVTCLVTHGLAWVSIGLSVGLLTYFSQDEAIVILTAAYLAGSCIAMLRKVKQSITTKSY